MIFGLLSGTLAGLGVAIATWGIFPSRKPLQLQLSGLANPSDASHPLEPRRVRIGKMANQWFRRLGLRGQGLQCDLRVAGRSQEELAIAKLAMLILGAGLPVCVWIVAWVQETWISPALVALSSILTGTLFFLVPDQALRKVARRRRQELRHHVSTYLDLVGLHLAGGSGIERALRSAADQGAAWSFMEIQRTLGQVELTNEPSWVGLERLGQELGSSDLVELGAWLRLASAFGSPVGSSLHVKARGLRERVLNDAETAAQQATERMSLPVVLMFSGFLGLIGYPAFAAILGA